MNKTIIKRIITFALCLVMTAGSALMMTGCGQQQTDAATIELQMNDYRGGVMRTKELKNAFVSLVDDMKQNNNKLRESNPNSYWMSDGYQDFVSNLMNESLIADTEAFTEEEAEWDDVLAEAANAKTTYTEEGEEGGVLKDGVTIKRNEKDDYTIRIPMEAYDDDTIGDMIGEGDIVIRMLYDCDKDWCKSTRKLELTDKTNTVPDATISLFEYARLDADTFAVQTSKERMIVKYKSVDGDTDLRDREVSEIYYSRLVKDGVRTTYKPFEPLEETDSELGIYNKENAQFNLLMKTTYAGMNNSGDLMDRYGSGDSMFLKEISDINSNWVFEDKSLQQAIIYKDGNLVVTTYNKLSGKYERFIYSKGDADDSQIPDIEKMVDIKNLVGVVKLETPSEPTETEKKEQTGNQTKEPVNDSGTSSETSETSETTPSSSEETSSNTSSNDNSSEESKEDADVPSAEPEGEQPAIRKIDEEE